MTMHELRKKGLFNFGPKLFAVSKAWRRVAGQVISDHGLTEATALPLISLFRNGDGVRQNKLAELLGLESASVVRVLDGLELRGLIRRQEDKLDRRAKLIWLTDKGLELTEEIEKLFTEVREDLLKGINAEDIEATERVLDQIGMALAERVCQRKP